MTQDYKENVLHYLAGDLQQYVGINEPQIQGISIISNELNTILLNDYFDTINWYGAYVGAKDNTQNSLNYSVLCVFGKLKGKTTQSTGIVILDERGVIVQVITNWSDGSSIKNISCLSVDDNGNYYGIEEDVDTGSKRIVDLNNIVLKLDTQSEYSATVINSYTIPTNTYNWEHIYYIKRNENKSKYFVVGSRQGNNHLTGIELDTSNNTWTYHTSSYTFPSALGMWASTLNMYNVYWNENDDLVFQIALYTNNSLHLLTKGTGAMNDRTIFTDTSGLTTRFAYSIFYSNETIYLALTQNDSNDTTNYYQIYRIDLSNNKIDGVSYQTSDYFNHNKMILFKANNTIYYTKMVSQDGTDNNFEVSFGLIDGIASYEETLGTMGVTSVVYTMIYPDVNVQYNKVKVYLQTQNKLFIVKFNWNPNNLEYNGAEFTSNTSLIPHKGSIEDENEQEIFNRNLYNTAIYLNRYTSTLQVPNGLLNNETLYNGLLYSSNNNIMVSSNINLIKNKYEELNVNFINTFNILDDDLGVENTTGASDLVNYMLTADNTASITKIRINYTDNTSEIKPLMISESSNDYVVLKSAFYVPKEVNTIDLISTNEQTTYKTIAGTDIETLKYYVLSQRVRIE